MHNDDVIWNCIGSGACAFYKPTQVMKLCKNPYNVTGQCRKKACPLACGNYGTVIEEDGVCYLTVKTIERAHMPQKMWERIPLPNNIRGAFEKIEQYMTHIYDEELINLCKKRYLRQRQTLITIRRMQLNPKFKMVAESRKLNIRERNREAKAEKKARLETAVEKGLMDRLKKGVYGDLYKKVEYSDSEEEMNESDVDALLEEMDSDIDMEDLEAEVELEEEPQLRRRAVA